MKRLFAAGFAVAVSACAASGIQVKEDQLRTFQIGTTTYQEVVSSLGFPNQRMANADGTKQAIYVYAEAQTRPETFIPIVGAFVGGMDSRSSVVILFFDKNDVLIDYKGSESVLGTGTGFSAGNVQGRTPDQPRQAE